MKKSLTTITLLFLIASSLNAQSEDDSSSNTFTVAFGSCNREDLPQVMWPFINMENPDLWIWLGDNIYGDSDVMDTLIAKYDRVLAEPGYQDLMSKAEILGTWDDHDYGKNDGGVEFWAKEGSQQAFLDFIGVSGDDTRRWRKGVYSSKQFAVGTSKIKVILLDSRYHRDPIERVEGVYQPNSTGTVLGSEQWQWLEDQLTDSEADVHLIGNGIQFLAEQHRFEKWANFPNERKKLLELIAKTKPRGVILMSGDRHIAEISEVEVDGLGYPVRDITASGLTHSYEEAGDEQNKLRISPLIGMKNFGLLKFSSTEMGTDVVVALKGLNDTTFYEARWTYE